MREFYRIFHIPYCTEIFFCTIIFFLFITASAGFIHRLFHTLWKTFIQENRGMSYLSRFLGTTYDISATFQ